MKKIILSLLSIVCFVLFIFNMTLVIAQTSYNQESNNNQNLAGGTGFMSYAVNQKNQLTDGVTYSHCNLDNGVFPPVVNDFDLDLLADIVIIQDTRFLMYDSDCNLQYEQSLISSPTARPSVINSNENNFPELVLSNTTHLLVYEYDVATVGFILIKQIDFSATAGDFYQFACSNSFSPAVKCIGFLDNTDEVLSFNISAGSVTEKTNELPARMYSFNPEQGATYIRKITDTTDGYLSMCNIWDGVGNRQRCALLNADGDYLGGSITSNLGSASGTLTASLFQTSYVSRMGNIERHFISLAYQKTAIQRASSYVYSTDGVLIWRNTKDGFDTNNASSNFMLADYDKDGVKEACILINNSNTFDTSLRCWTDPNFNTIKYEHNFTSVLNLTPSVTMGDFYPGSTYMGLATIEGVFIYNDTAGTPQAKYLTKNHADYWSDTTSAIYSTRTSVSPVYVYTDSDSSLVISNPNINELCGNGVCEPSENEFSCPSDCVNRTAFDECDTDDQCPSNYPVCYLGACIRGVSEANITCIQASDCPISDPICFEGLCVNSISGSTNESIYTIDPGTTTQNNEIKESIGNAVSIFTGGSPFVKFLIGMAMILIFGIGTMIVLAMSGGGPHSASGGLITAFFVAVLTTGLTMTPIVVPIIMFMLASVLTLLSISNKN